MAKHLVTLDPLDDEDEWVTSRLNPLPDDDALSPAAPAAKAAEPQTWVQRLSARFGLPGPKEAGD